MSAFSSRKIFTAAAIAEALGECDAFMVRRVLVKLAERGEITRKGRGKYSNKGDSKPRKKSAPVTSRALRAMYLSKVFISRDIALLADAKRNFVNSLIRRLAASGEIVPVGRQKDTSGQMVTAHKVKDRDAFYLKHIIGGNITSGKGNL
jgi:hypothetical protein